MGAKDTAKPWAVINICRNDQLDVDSEMINFHQWYLKLNGRLHIDLMKITHFRNRRSIQCCYKYLQQSMSKTAFEPSQSNPENYRDAMGRNRFTLIAWLWASTTTGSHSPPRILLGRRFAPARGTPRRLRPEQRALSPQPRKARRAGCRPLEST